MAIPMPEPPAPPRRRGADPWLLAALALTVAGYLLLALLRPAGEGFGRGWNLIAFYLYASPLMVAAGGLALWRRGRAAGLARRAAPWLAAAGLLFPLLAPVILRAKA